MTMMIDPMSCGMPSTDHAKKPMWPAPNSSACVAAMTLTGEPSMVSLAPFRHASASGIISCDGNEIPSRGPLSILTVPGAVDGWRAAHERFGRVAWKDLFDDAITYARDGVAVSRSLMDWLVQDVPILTRSPATAAIFLPGGRVPREGQRLVQADLARSFEHIANQGARAGFYEGAIAERICAGLQPQG